MKKYVLVFGLLLLLLTGCSKELSHREVAIQDANADVQDFVQTVRKDNGYYLYMDGKDTYYLFLNGSIGGLEETVTHFSNLTMDVRQDDLILSFQESQVSVNSLETEPKSIVLYRIQTDRPYDTIRLQVNGEEAGFDMISGN
ncbi:hypothetical protein AB1K83_14760 [Sporosarcina sp. 179-K 3D1 HS]|uniref:hypothetical protein n=1 Tax=Sporosarcina sp. 179-K 3D1 HS TaxID=3232169 RepID=UPI00399FE1D7